MPLKRLRFSFRSKYPHEIFQIEKKKCILNDLELIVLCKSASLNEGNPTSRCGNYGVQLQSHFSARTVGNLKMARPGQNKRLTLHLLGLYAVVEPT